MTDHERQRPLPRILSAFLAFSLPLTVYLYTMAPTVFGLDSAELTTGAYSLGIVHSPGAPTYMLLGHLFSKFPMGDVGFRLNLLSVVCGAVTVMMVYRIALELRSTVTAALIASGFLAFSFYFWAWALVAELYSVHALFSSAILLCLLLWQRTQGTRYLSAASLLFGVGLGNHTALILQFPAYAWLALSPKPSLLKRPKALLTALLCGMMGLSVYAYFPIRHAAQPPMDYIRTYFPEVNLASPQGLFWMMRGSMFESLFFSLPIRALPGEGLHFFHVLISNFTPFGLVLTFLGCAWLHRRNRVANIALVLMFALHSVFFLTYGALDKFWMFSVSYVILAIWASLGVVAAEFHVQGRFPHLPRGVPTGVATASLILLVAVNWPRLNLTDDFSARNLGFLLTSRMEKSAVYLGLWEQIPILEYLQVVEKHRIDIDLHNSVFLDPARVRHIIDHATAEGRPVYAADPKLTPFTHVEVFEIVPNNLYRIASGRNKEGVAEIWQESRE